MQEEIPKDYVHGGRKPGKYLFIISLLIVTALALGIFYLFIRPKPYNLLQKDLKAAQASVNFPLYTPNKLPAGFSYKPGSTKYSKGVVIFSLNLTDNQKLYVSDQAKPAGVDFNDFYNRVLVNKADALSPEGKAVVGTLNNETTGSLVTDKVWVLINTKAAISRQTMSQILGSLQPVR